MNPLLLSLLFAIAAISTIVGLSKILPDNLFSKKEPQKATDTTDIPEIPSDTIEKIPNPPTPTEKIEKTDIPTTPSDIDKNTQNPITPTEKIENTEKTDNGKIIWDYLINTLGLTEEGAAGLMGNFQAESRLESAIYENNYKKKLGLTNQKYVDKVNDGTYNIFTDDRVGFGIAQWTLPFRKTNLLNKCKGKIRFCKI